MFRVPTLRATDNLVRWFSLTKTNHVTGLMNTLRQLACDVAPPPIEPAKELSEGSGEIACAAATFNLGFSPFTIMSPGLLKVRAVRGDDLVRLGGMEIVVQPASKNPFAPQPTT
jgi:hypothetical protein